MFQETPRTSLVIQLANNLQSTNAENLLAEYYDTSAGALIKTFVGWNRGNNARHRT